MAKLVKLEIRNFRGIKELDLDFDPFRNIVCLVGRGDTGKTTILEAIALVLSPAWNLSFHDTDFFNCEYANPIEITAHLINPPEKLLTIERFGFFVRNYDTATKIISDDLEQEETVAIPLLSLKLVVDHTLEPQWTITNVRDQEDKRISSNERSLFNCYMVADNLDRHFSWSKGNPLYNILRSGEIEPVPGEKNVIIETLRKAKLSIDAHGFPELQEVTDIVTSTSAQLGLNITGSSTTLDFRDLSIKDSRVSLHDDKIPFRLKGKGSKRLISFAIQLAYVKNGGIMLVDELEQGLEPDRIKQLVRSLKENTDGMIFITTHSREVITELGAGALCMLVKNLKDEKIHYRPLVWDEETLTGVVRACPEAFFASKVIVCEGATEVGICRALDRYRLLKQKDCMSFKNCAYIDGSGSNLLTRVYAIKQSGLSTALLCDSDEVEVNAAKAGMRENDIFIFDCEPENSIEMQVFADLPWPAIKELLDYVLIAHKKNNPDALKESIRSKFPAGMAFPDNYLDTDSTEMRNCIKLASTIKDKEWFKRIDHGEFLGNIIFKYFDTMVEQVHLKKVLTSLSNWIDT